MPIRRKYRAQFSRKKEKRTFKLFGRLGFRLPKIGKNKGLIKKSARPNMFRRVLRARKEKSTGIKKLFKLFLKLVLAMFIIAIIGVAGAFIYFSKDIPSPDKIVSRSVSQSTKIYDRTGQHLLYEIHGEEKRTVVKLDQISKNLINATIATEDQRFYKHYGIDFKGIIRAIYKDITHRQTAQGGSTITQQLVKNSILTSERTFTRKIKEIILAIETEQKFSKDQILEMYLNQIPYGSNAYGTESAAQTFFGKSAKDLDVPEAALLAALPKATTYYSPYNTNPEAIEGLKSRYKMIINQMREEGYINEEEAKKANEIEILKKVKPFRESIKAPHFVMYVREQLIDEFGEEEVEKGGLKVYTTLNYEMQLIAEDAIIKKEARDNMQKYGASNAALVAINPKDGQILSMVGSKDYFNIEEEGNVNVALSSQRQPGSSFKPFVYATAFKKGYTPDTVLFDVKTNFGKDGSGKNYSPNNYNERFSGPVKMREALARSLNIPAVKTLYLAGIENSIQTAHDLGITTLNDPKKYGLSLVLGTGGVKLLDMVSAYGVFANDGIRNSPVSILKIEDMDGKILKEFQSNPKEVLDEEVARNINSILSDNNARAPIFGANNKLTLKDRSVAAKSGTTSSFKDAWTIGYTPSLSAGVWTGNNDGKEMGSGADGSKIAAPIWNDFMARVLDLDPVEKFSVPQKIETKKPVLNGRSKNEVIVKIDKACGDKLASELTPESQIEERTYLEAHSILYYVNKDDPKGEYPKSPQDNPQFANWETPVLAWAKENMGEGINVNPPTEICQLREKDNVPEVKIISPKNDQIINENRLRIEAEASDSSNVEQLEFYFDSESIGIDKFPPYEAFYNIPPAIQEGSHDIRVRLYDKIFNSSEDKVSIITGSKALVYLKPIVGDAFPFVLYAVAPMENLASVSFYYQLDSIYNADMQLVEKPGPERLIGKINTPVPGENNLFQILWEEDKEYFISGKYKIFTVMEDRNGKAYKSNERFLEIK